MPSQIESVLCRVIDLQFRAVADSVRLQSARSGGGPGGPNIKTDCGRGNS